MCFWPSCSTQIVRLHMHAHAPAKFHLRYLPALSVLLCSSAMKLGGLLQPCGSRHSLRSLIQWVAHSRREYIPFIRVAPCYSPLCTACADHSIIRFYERPVIRLSVLVQEQGLAVYCASCSWVSDNSIYQSGAIVSKLRDTVVWLHSATAWCLD